MTLYEKAKPKFLSEMDYNPKLTSDLQKMALSPRNSPNLLFYGPPGSGKYTYVLAYLREIFGDKIDYARTQEEMAISGGTKAKVAFTTKNSNYHYELNPSDYGVYDKDIISSFLREKSNVKNLASDLPSFVVIYDADKLTQQAQNSLRFLIERQIDSVRFIFICHNISSIIHPLISRFSCVRVPAPSEDEIKNVLIRVKDKYKLEDFSKNAMTRIINYCNDMTPTPNNLKLILQILDLSIVNGKYKRYELNYESYLDYLVNAIMIPQDKVTLQLFEKLRESFYILFTNNLETKDIFRLLIKKIIRHPRISHKIKEKAIRSAAQYQLIAVNSNKDIVHLEAFMFGLIGLKKNPGTSSGSKNKETSKKAVAKKIR